AALAMLTRPNLVALLAIAVGFYAVRALYPPATDSRRAALRRLALFACGAAAGGVVAAAINRSLYGSAWRFGYGELETLYAWADVLPNLDRYPRWLIESETPFMCLAVLAPWLARRPPHTADCPPMDAAYVWLLVAFAGGVFA